MPDAAARVNAAKVLGLDLLGVIHHVASQIVHVAIGSNLPLQPRGEASAHLVAVATSGLGYRA